MRPSISLRRRRHDAPLSPSCRVLFLMKRYCCQAANVPAKMAASSFRPPKPTDTEWISNVCQLKNEQLDITEYYLTSLGTHTHTHPDDILMSFKTPVAYLQRCQFPWALRFLVPGANWIGNRPTTAPERSRLARCPRPNVAPLTLPSQPVSPVLLLVAVYFCADALNSSSALPLPSVTIFCGGGGEKWI